MTSPLEGRKVVEVRVFRMRNPGYDTDLNTAFELDNRGKRSLVLDLDRPGARAVVHRLVKDADVFLTNLTAPRREKYGLGFAELSAMNRASCTPRSPATARPGPSSGGRASTTRRSGRARG